MKSLVFLIAILITTVNFSYVPVLAEQTITVFTDKPSYQYGDKYTISGKVDPVVQNQLISIHIQSPNHLNPELLSFTPGPDGKYSYTLPVPTTDIPPGNFTLIATYAGTENQTTFSYNGPPCNRQSVDWWWHGVHSAPATNPRIVDSSGNAITGSVKVGQQIQITAPLVNGLDCFQPFVYIVQVQDQNGVTVSLSWISGTMLAGQSLDPAQSWIPISSGMYTAQIFTWSSLDNPNALNPPLSVVIPVA